MNNEKIDISKNSSEQRHDRTVGWIAKIVCLLTAFIIWFYVMQVDSPQYEETISGVSVTLENTSLIENVNELYVYSGYGNEIDVTVVGKRSAVSRLSPDDISAYVDVSGITASGQHSLDIHFKLPNGITVTSSSAGSINVYVDKKDVQTVTVKPKLTSVTVPHPYEVGMLQTEYAAITVTGPKTALNELSHAEVALSLGNVESSVTAIGTLYLVDKDGDRVDNPYLKLSHTEVKVTVPVYTTKTVPLVVGLKYGYLNESNSLIKIEPEAVTVKGDPLELQNINSLKLMTVDEKEIKSGSTMTVAVDPGSKLTLTDGPVNATVTVNLINTNTRTLTVTDIDASDASVPYEILDRSVRVTLRGSADDLAELVQSDISIKVDLGDFTPEMKGTFTVPATIIIDSVSDGIIYEVGNYSVQVKIGE